MNWRSRLKRLLPVEALIVLAAFVPYTRHGREAHHDLLASFLFDQPGYIVSSLINLAVLNLIVIAIIFVFTRATKK